MRESEFAQELSNPRVDLVRAALLLAREIAYPELDVAAYLQQLGRLGELAAVRIRPADSLSERAAAVAGFLFAELGWRGNEADYFDPRNSYLNEVLDRGLGIPLSLSILYMAVARHAGLSAHGLNLPGHFVVLVRDDDLDLIVDPFHQGQPLTRQQCARLVRRTSGYQGPFQTAWLLPATTRIMLARMLNNLRLIYVQAENWPLALAVMERIHWLEPREIAHWRDLGLLYYQTGAMRQAAIFLERYLQQDPESDEARRIVQNVAPGLGQWVRAN